jgi:PadR family transcriptional regulator PadR
MDYTSKVYWNAVMNAGLCKFLILHAVCEAPAHGYAIIQRLSEMTGRVCVPTQGTVYPVLREFAKCGCVSCRTETVGGRERKVYVATPKGRKALAAGTEVWQQGLAQLQTIVGAIPVGLVGR